MPCYFSGVFFVRDITQYQVNCQFLDEYSSPQTVQMTYFFPSASDLANSPFCELEPLEPNNVYFISGTVSIFDGEYGNPAVRLPHVTSLIRSLSFKSITPSSCTTIRRV
jgi:hypothetical protein